MMKQKGSAVLAIVVGIALLMGAAINGLALRRNAVSVERLKAENEQLAEDSADIIKRLQVYAENNFSPQLGADNVLLIAGTSYTLSGSGISSSAASIGLTSLTIPQNGYEIVDGDLSATFYVTLEPGSRTRQEITSCTTVTQNADNTATLSGCTRGLSPIAPYTASSTLQFSHAGGTKLIFSDPPQVYNQAAFKDNDETISGTWTFSSTSLPLYDGTPNFTSIRQLVDKNYVDGIAAQGVATATESTFGGVKLASSTSAALGIATSSSAIGAAPLVLSSRYATSTRCYNGVDGTTPTGNKYCVAVTQANGRLTGDLLDTNYGFNFSASTTFTASTTLGIGNASTTIVSDLFVQSATTTIAGATMVWPSATSTANSGRNNFASSSVLTMGQNGNLTWNYPYYPSVIGVESRTINSVGDQVITHNLNRPPQMIEIVATAITNDGTSPFLANSTGYWSASSSATLATTTAQYVIGGAVKDSVTVAGSQVETHSGAIICLTDSGGCRSGDVFARIKNITSISFTIDWEINTNEGASRRFMWKVW